MTHLHIDYMKKRWVKVYSVYMTRGHYVFWVDEMDSVISTITLGVTSYLLLTLIELWIIIRSTILLMVYNQTIIYFKNLIY